jgi:threonine dehydrogenase-like Zn-dependent dehydrogenase
MDDTGELVYLNADGEIEFREYEVPDPEPGAVMAEVVRANVCGSELHILSGDHPLSELVMGHEVVCRVAALGDGVETDYAERPVEEGDLIAPVYYRTCRRCPACGRGQFHLCHNRDDGWLSDPDDPPHFHGTYGTHYHVGPDQYFYKVPEGLPASTVAAANCALSQVLFGIDEVDVSYGESVVIQGAGGLGLNSVAVCNERGAETIVIEGTDGRIERAEAFGADHVIDFREHDTVAARAERVRELTDGLGADVGIEVAGVPEAFSEGIELVRTGGRYLELGNVTPGPTTEFDVGGLTRKSISIVSAVRYPPWYLRRALSFLEDTADEYPYDDLLDATFPLREVEEAFEVSRNREVTRATLDPRAD